MSSHFAPLALALGQQQLLLQQLHSLGQLLVPEAQAVHLLLHLPEALLLLLQLILTDTEHA